MCTKTCRTCGNTKPLDDFPWQQKHGFRGDTPGHFRKDCKECTAAKAREYRKTYVRSRELRKDVDKLLYSACSVRVADAKARATRSSIPFSITQDYMYDLLIQQGMRCALTRFELSIEKGNPAVLSIDQIEAGAGYVEGNVRWVMWAANRAKGDLSSGEFVEMCRAVVRCNDYPEGEYSQAAGSAHQQKC